mmetsp:Transcript_66832/g.156617  ORF Transcript_66832/g.156617 Transcript_66832/m.156617 type:complete len:233 (-) Transcript_66832:8-706(-)|eukprot:s4174_g6.t1
MLRITQLSGEELTSIPIEELSDVKALKQRLHENHGLPPRFRQRLLHGGTTLDDAAKLDSVMDLEVVALHGFCEASESQRTALCHAIERDSMEEVEELLQIPLDPDAMIAGTDTPLMQASCTDSIKVTILLIEAGANKDLRDNAGRTALMAAAMFGCLRVLQCLLDSGAQMDLQDHQGFSAMMFAALYNQAFAASLLLDAGARQDLRDNGGRTALHWATEAGNDTIEQLLLEP